MAAYYNEIDPFAAQWLRNLISEGLIADGEVDERSIVDVGGDDVRGFERCHFFAGIAGWDRALQWAGWEGSVWTGSCPCQPFSSAGQRKGHADERHLWPAFHRLIAECHPPTVFGEQVASKDGREWLSAVRVDLERLGYACGAADIPAAGVGAPHIRQRLWWVAHADDQRPTRIRAAHNSPCHRSRSTLRKGSVAEGVGHSKSREMGSARQSWEITETVDCADGQRRPVEPGTLPMAYGFPGRMEQLRAYGNAIVPQVAAEFISAFMEGRP